MSEPDTSQDGSDSQHPGSRPPPLPPLPQRPRPTARVAPRPRRLRPVPSEPLERWQSIRVAVTIMVWSVVVVAAVALALAKPHSLEGVMANVLMLVCLPTIVVALLAGVGSLLHSLAREGWSMLSAVGPWLLLAGMATLLALYPDVKAINQVPIF